MSDPAMVGGERMDREGRVEGDGWGRLTEDGEDKVVVVVVIDVVVEVVVDLGLGTGGMARGSRDF